MSKRIYYINPVGSDEYNKPLLDHLNKVKRDDTEIVVESLTKGPPHVAYRYYESLVIPEMLHKIKQAENEGYDGAIIGCFYDPALYAAKEITSKMVVTAPAEASMLIGSTLGYKFSIINGYYSWTTINEETVINYGFEKRLASFKLLNLGVLDFHKDKRETKKRMMKVAKEAIEIDHAEVIILACTLEFGFYEELQKELGVPVLDTAISALKYAEFLVEIKKKLNWGISKVGAFVMPPLKEIKDFKLEEQYGVPNLWT